MEKTYRLSLRMPRTLIEQADKYAAEYGITRTEVAELGLRHLVHDMQVDRISKSDYNRLHSNPDYGLEQQSVQMRLPRIMIDYLRMNVYNVSACVREALTIMINRTHNG